MQADAPTEVSPCPFWIRQDQDKLRPEMHQAACVNHDEGLRELNTNAMDRRESTEQVSKRIVHSSDSDEGSR